MAHKDLLQALAQCTATCEMSSDALLDEDHLKKLVRCIRLTQDCARICSLAHSFAASHAAYTNAILKQCADICHACAEECSRHTMDHCQACAQACRACEEACLLPHILVTNPPKTLH